MCGFPEHHFPPTESEQDAFLCARESLHSIPDVTLCLKSREVDLTMRPSRGGGTKMAVPDTLNSMAGGAQSLFAQQAASRKDAANGADPSSRSKVDGWLATGGGSADASLTAADGGMKFGAPTQQDVGAVKPPISGAAARLLAKTANEKIATFNKAIAGVGPHLGPEEVENSINESSAPESGALRAKAADDREMVRSKDTRVRVTILQCKHLPRMDTFGKTDAFCIISVDNKKAGGQKMKRKTVVVKKNLNPVFTNQSFDFNIRDYPSQVALDTIKPQ